MNNKELEIRVVDMTSDTPKETTIKMPKLPAWTMAAEIGYTPKTTFWSDFSIADRFGFSAIMDTFQQSFNSWKHDVEYIAELALVLNHKGLWYYTASEQRGGDAILSKLSELYFTLWENLHEWAKRNYMEKPRQFDPVGHTRFDPR